ncbi:hypothetical protein ACL9RL_07020 [Plantibacter sp. Mn2098]|uniref:hypothetical protein n=1 Tax=Plantibacter sp. Mn2098 TaxID=3395266 RepID=UPI003BC1B8B3
MTSQALARWGTARRAALDRLERVHAVVTGGLAGRPHDVTELNHALFLRLAAEIQGFCRDIHDEACDVICAPRHVPNTDVRAALKARLVAGRKLDTGNAGPGNIGSDWGRFGMTLWPGLAAAYPGVRGATDWNARLEWLNTARNGIAHNDPARIAAAHGEHSLTMHTFRVTRRRLDRFTSALDAVTEAYLMTTLSIASWTRGGADDDQAS